MSSIAKNYLHILHLCIICLQFNVVPGKFNLLMNEAAVVAALVKPILVCLEHLKNNMYTLEVLRAVGPRLLVGGRLRALWALRPCDPRNAAIHTSYLSQAPQAVPV